VTGIGGDLDPDINLDVDILKGEFLYKTPGYNNIALLHELNLEEGYY
jgi:hypothetical protein